MDWDLDSGLSIGQKIVMVKVRMNKFNIWQYLGAKMDRGQFVLGLGVDGGSLRDQEASNLLVTLLAG